VGHLGAHLPYSIKGARALGHLALSPADACARKHAYAIFEGSEKRGLYSDGFAAATRHADVFETFRAVYGACTSPDPVDRALYVDVKTYMADDILVKVDRMSMAVSLETREPLLDHRLLEFAASVPSSLKLRGKTRKYLLRRLLRPRVPASILGRGKQGFEPPTGEWLRGPLAEMTHELLMDGRLRDRGIFDERAVRRLWDDHRTERRDHRERLWTLVMLELWFREYIDRAGAPTLRSTRADIGPAHAPAPRAEVA
jgi:asparagine synthase (glutamine-hydrolysing)